MLDGVLGLLQSIKILKNKKKKLFWVARDLHVCPWAFSSFRERGLLSGCCAQPLTAVASPVAEPGP